MWKLHLLSDFWWSAARAMREKEKKIGSSYINLSEYCSLEQTGIGEELKVMCKKRF